MKISLKTPLAAVLSGALLFGALATSVTAQIADPAITFIKNGALWVMNTPTRAQYLLLIARIRIHHPECAIFAESNGWVRDLRRHAGRERGEEQNA